MPPNDWMKKYTGYLKDVEGSVTKKDVNSGEKKHVPYQDVAGNWTIGYGKRISKDDLGEGKIQTKKVSWSKKPINIWVGGTSWSEGEAEEALQSRALSSLNQAERYAKDRGFDWGKISDRQKHGLADFMYNLGPTKMNAGRFKNTMGMYLSGDDVVTKGFHKRYAGEVELSDRNKKWKELFGGLPEDVAMGNMLQQDNPLGVK